MHRSTLRTLDDAELAERAQGGHRDALEALIDRYRRFVRAKARSYFLIGGDTDDIEQEALIGLYKAVRDYRPDHLASFRGFAELCITRQVITAIKTANRHKHQALNQYVSISGVRGGDEPGERSVEDMLPAARGTDPGDRVVAQERLEMLRGSIADRLSPLEVDVLELHVDGRSYVEIGERLGRHTKSIDNALQRIKRKLEQCLADEAEAQDSRLATAV